MIFTRKGRNSGKLDLIGQPVHSGCVLQHEAIAQYMGREEAIGAAL